MESTQMTENEKLMTTKQAAELLGTTTKTVLDTAERKGLKRKLGRFKRQYRWTRAQALSLVDDTPDETTPPADKAG